MSKTLREASLPRYAMRREEAAASVGVSPSKFDEWIRDGRMPAGRKIDGLKLWDTDEVRDHWHALRDGTIVGNPLDNKVL